MSGWEKRRVPLPFRVGDVSLAEVALNAAVMTRHFTELSPEVGEIFPREVLRELGADVAVIHSCPIASPPPRLSRKAGGVRYVPAQFPRYHAEATGSFEEYLGAAFSSKSRATLRRKVKKLTGRGGGGVDLREYRTPDEVGLWHRLARKVSEKTYQERLLKRGLPDDPDYVGSVREMASRDRFRGYLLFYSGEPIAFLACPITGGGAMIYDHVGHDPDHEKLSPGTVLLYSVLERAFADESIRMFDFTEGEGEHKQRFATHETACADIFFFAPSARNVITVAVHAGIERATRLSAAALERAGAKERIKRFLRTLR